MRLARVGMYGAVAGTLVAAGAILFGKTTTPEFGHKALTDAPLFGRTRNAWSAGRTSGGSSGGAAVAVATLCAHSASRLKPGTFGISAPEKMPWPSTSAMIRSRPSRAPARPTSATGLASPK